jgi:hypothetical protein
LNQARPKRQDQSNAREADEWLSSAIRCATGALDRAQQANPESVRPKLEELARLGRQAGVLAERETR